MLDKKIFKKASRLCVMLTLIILKTDAMITNISTLATIHNALCEEAQEDTLVVFDIDGTLMDDYTHLFEWNSLFHFLWEPEHTAPEDQEFIIEAKKAYAEYKIQKDNPNLDSIIEAYRLAHSKVELIEPEISLSLIHTLQARGAKVIALTAVTPGIFGEIPCARILRFNMLQKAKIDFSSAFDSKPIIFKTLQPYNNDYPMYYKGILFANEYNEKGKVLAEFLNKIQYRPRCVFFIDDKLKHVETVTREMTNLNIECHAYRIQIPHKLPDVKFNKEIAKIQLRYLLDYDKYLTVDEAEIILLSQRAVTPWESKQHGNASGMIE